MRKNISMFIAAATFALAAGFVFFMIAPHAAMAYAVGGGSTGSAVPAPAGSGAGGYDLNNSFQNLVSPFTGFVNDLKWNNTNVSVNNLPSFSTPNLNGTSEIQSLILGWLQQFDTWFYGVSGIQLSGIIYMILNAIAWTLGLAQQVVNWLIGLFHA